MRNITLEEISKVTRINKNYLQALESDRYDLLPGKAFSRGFLRGYCRIVGLDPEEVLLRFESSLEEKPSIPPPVTKNQKRLPAWLYLIPPIIIAGMLLLILLPGKGRSPAPPPRKAGQEGEAPPSLPSRTGTDSPRQVVIPSSEGLTLKVKAVKETWMLVRADDQPPADVILQTDEEHVWRAERILSLRIGNAGGVSVTLNDKPLGPLGPEGKVVGLVFTAR